MLTDFRPADLRAIAAAWPEASVTASRDIWIPLDSHPFVAGVLLRAILVDTGRRSTSHYSIGAYFLLLSGAWARRSLPDGSPLPAATLCGVIRKYLDNMQKTPTEQR